MGSFLCTVFLDIIAFGRNPSLASQVRLRGRENYFPKNPNQHMKQFLNSKSDRRVGDIEGVTKKVRKSPFLLNRVC